MNKQDIIESVRGVVNGWESLEKEAAIVELLGMLDRNVVANWARRQGVDVVLTRGVIEQIVSATPDIRSAGGVGGKKSATWGGVWADVIVDDSLDVEEKRRVASDIVVQAFPDVQLVEVRVGFDEKGYDYRSPKGKDVVSMIFNIKGHPHYDWSIVDEISRGL